ncbi:glycosyltransferase family 2 protein [Candidatus Margulisiibacteriota bacterium]
MAKDLAIVIPVYNEGVSITETIKQIRDKVSCNYQIYIVYDFDEDSTLPYLKEFSADILTPLKNKFGRGALNAIKTGLKETKEKYVVVFMADLSEDPVHIDDLVRKAGEGYDIVCGSRYMRGGKQIGGPKLKSFLSRMGGVSLRLLSGIPTHDISNSFKLYSRSVLDSIEIKSTGGFEIGMEIVVKAYLKGYKIAEVPAVWKDRAQGKSRFKLLKWLPKYLYWYFYLLGHKYSPIKKP